MPEFFKVMLVLIGFCVFAIVIAAMICVLMGRREPEARDTEPGLMPRPLVPLDIDLSDGVDVRQWPKTIDTGERRRRTDFDALDELDRGMR